LGPGGGSEADVVGGGSEAARVAHAGVEVGCGKGLWEVEVGGAGEVAVCECHFCSRWDLYVSKSTGVLNFLW